MKRDWKQFENIWGLLTVAGKFSSNQKRFSLLESEMVELCDVNRTQRQSKWFGFMVMISSDEYSSKSVGSLFRFLENLSTDYTSEMS